VRELSFGRSRDFDGKLWLMENSEFVEALSNRRLLVSGSFDAIVDIANQVV